MNNREEVILVDENDRERGTMEKLEAHRKGELHRAFSVFVFDSDGYMILQQRAAEKYHSAGLWTNTCCSHPRPGEDLAMAAARRLKEEMGLNTPLVRRTSFIYRAEFENGLVEHEFDHIFTGVTDADAEPDPAEVADVRWMRPDEIRAEIKADPSRFTPWFRIAMEQFF